MQTILVTGGAKRIGKTIIELFAKKNWRVIIHYNKSKLDAEDLASKINSNNDNSAFIVGGDLDNAEDVQSIISSVNSISETLDLLVNNASTFYPTPIEKISNDHWNKLIGSNLKGPLFLIQGFQEKLKSSKGSIINITDTNLTKGVANFSIYSAFKSFVFSGNFLYLFDDITLLPLYPLI